LKSHIIAVEKLPFTGVFDNMANASTTNNLDTMINKRLLRVKPLYKGCFSQSSLPVYQLNLEELQHRMSSGYCATTALFMYDGSF
jgi:hypothetical protein